MTVREDILTTLPFRVDDRPSAPSRGRVVLIGAGPGDPELITVRGLRALQQAEVLVYDRLVGPELIDEAPEWAEKIYVGKQPGHHAMPQDDINALLVDRARLGLTVVRLKGGDPFIFGRGGEEALACAEADIPFEIVPGISSSASVPSNAGIPLTHRGVAASFAVMTAHRALDLDAQNPAWEGFAKVDTLVILMGVARLEAIVANLQHHGRDAATPVAIIERGTLPDERITVATLADIAPRARALGVRSPAVIVVGEVVRLRDQLGQAVRQVPLEAVPEALLTVAAG